MRISNPYFNLVFCLLAAASWGCSKTREPAKHEHATHEPARHEPAAHEPARHEHATHEPAKQEHATHEPAKHEHAKHGDEGESIGAEALKALSIRRCEHDELVLECDECRYEVGAVHVPSSLMDGSKDPLIRTARVQAKSSQRRLFLTGEVTYDENKLVHISPRVKGVARRVLVTLGDRVKAGEMLVEMDSLELGKLRSRLLKARAEQELAQQNFDREKRLFSEKISSGKELAGAETALKRARIELRSTTDQLRLLGLSRGQLEQTSTGRLALRSPRGGIVVAKHVVTGELVSPDKVIMTVADLDAVWVRASVYERDLAQLLSVGNETKPQATVTVKAFPKEKFKGIVDYVGAIMDEATRTVKVRVVVDNKRGLLRPGMFADLTVDLGRGEALLVPARAVVRDEQRQFVFVRLGERRFIRRDVQVGATRAGRVEILGGLRSGEEIVVTGAFLLKSDILREKMGAGCAD